MRSVFLAFRRLHFTFRQTFLHEFHDISQTDIGRNEEDRVLRPVVSAGEAQGIVGRIAVQLLSISQYVVSQWMVGEEEILKLIEY